MSLVGIVMAAGEGTRMRSRTPKPLHRICGKEMIRYPVDLLREAGAERVVVVVSRGNREAVHSALGDSVEYAIQEQRNGTGGAIAACRELLAGSAARVLVIGGDTPLVTGESMERIIASHSAEGAQMTVLTASVPASVTGRQSRPALPTP